MKKKTGIFPLVLVLILSISVLLPGCSSPESEKTAAPTAAGNQSPAVTQKAAPGTSQPPVSAKTPDTGFARMLGMVPFSFLEKHDVWFGDLEKALELYNIRDVNSLDDLMQLPTDDRKQVVTALQGIAGMFTISNWQRIAPATGFDVWAADRSIFRDSIPPQSFYVHEGDFNGDLIQSKLTELGYRKVEYGAYAYYSINEDYSPGNLTSPVSQEVLSAMNRVAVLDNLVIIAPATDVLTGILDTLSGKATPVVDDPACRALAESLGEVLSGVIMNPERTINLNPPQPMPPFQFTVPADWGLLHEYEMTGIGYKNDGQDRYWVISLYYQDAGEAEADAETLVRRMKSYILNTQFDQTPGQSFKTVPLTEVFEVGRPVVQEYSGGATLTVESRLNPETSASSWLRPLVEMRDLLFLAPDPAPYVKK